jgi:putative colanic acid biosynthesis acetyltransferase WcaF
MSAGTSMDEREPQAFTGVPPSSHSLKNRVARALWGFVWLFLFRPTPKKLFAWRRMLLQLFGARLSSSAIVFPSTQIWAPWNLEMADHACLAWGVDCYNVAPIRLGRHALVSQRAFLCTATHDIDAVDLPLISRPITIEDNAWVCAEAFVAPGVTIGSGAVVGARSVVTKSVNAWDVVAGNPARVIRQRRLNDGRSTTVNG